MMKKVIKFGARETMVVKNANPKAILGHIYLVGDTDNEEMVPDVAWGEVQCDVKLKQGGEFYPVYNGSLLPWIYEEAMFARLGENYALTDVTLLAHGASNKAQGLITFKLNFGTVINLDGDDELIIDMYFPTGFFGASTTVDSANSYITITAEDGIGVQEWVPKIAYRSIPDASTRESYELGDNIQRVVFINTELDAFTDALKKVNSVHLYSDRITYSKDYYDLIADQNHNPVLTEDTLYHRFPLLTLPADNVKVDLVLNPTLIDANENFVVYRQFATTKAILAKANRLMNKHEIQDATKAR